jgi:hypothetical protein
MIKNEYGFQDFTQLMELVERTENIWETMGLLDSTETQYWTSTGGKMRRITDGEDGIDAKARGADRNYVGRENAVEKYFDTAFFPLDGSITAQDIQDLINLDTEDTPETVANRIRRMVARIQRSHAKNLQKAMYYAIKENKTYHPSMPTKEQDFSTEFGAPRKAVVAADFDLTDVAVDPFVTLEKEGRRHIIAQAGDNADGYEIMFACSSDVFDGLIAHPKFEGAYSEYMSTQEPLRQRIAGDRNNRVFKHKGILVVEMIEPAAKGGFDADKGYLLPLGMDGMFQLAYAPADVVELANTEAQEAYLFLESTPRKQTLQSEASFVLVNCRPELCVSFTATL